MNNDIRNVRLARLRELRDQRFQGNSKRLAAAIKRSESQVSQWFTGVRTLTEGSARRIEQVLSLPAGWLDTTERAVKGTGGVAVGGRADTWFTGGIRITQLDVTASMGAGAVVPTHEDVVTALQVNELALRAQLGHTHVSALRNLRLISAYGDSMAPTFAGGDLLLVDTGVDDVRLDAVYVLSYRNELFIKRLQRRPNGVLRMLSDNKVYDPIDIENGERDQFRVLGRVLLAWNARML